MAYKDLAKDAIIIGFTQVMVNLGNFLLLPIITKTLGSNDYGLWIQVLVTISLLSSVAILGQNTTLLRFLKAGDDKKRLSVEYFTVLYIVSLAGVVLAVAMLAFSVPLAELIFSDKEHSLLLVAAAMIVPFTAFTGITSAYFRGTGQIKTYAAINIFHAFGEAALILLFVIGGMGILGAVVGALIASFVSFIIGFIIVVRQVGVSRPDRAVVGRNMKFGFPLAPNNIIQWVITSSDRYLIAVILGLSLAGIYSAAYGIGAVIFLFVAPIQMILYPTLARFYDEGRVDMVKEYTRRSFRYYMIITMPAVVGISALSAPILVAMTTPEFAPGALVIPLVAVAGLFSGMFRFVENVPHLVRKTHLNLITFGVPAAADVILVITLTPFMGIVGAALATTISYALMLAIGVVISRQFMKFTIDLPSAIKSVAASLLMAVIILLLDPVGLLSIVATIVVAILAYFLVLYIMKGFDRQELDILRYYIQKVRKKVDESGASAGGGRRLG
ncbi:MAG: flippase [Methanomassiliicoccus sp.]|nr:flippase [Methanomassiliicoccus sp.]